jgi:hypothetical protein
MAQHFAHLGNSGTWRERCAGHGKWRLQEIEQRLGLRKVGFAVYVSADQLEHGVKGMSTRDRASKKLRRRIEVFAPAVFLVVLGVLVAGAAAQTNCAEGNGILDTAPPKDMTVAQLIQKIAAEETKVKEARTHYTYTQDVLVQTLNGKAVDGQFHEVTNVSYDSKGKRLENVTFAEQSTLRGVQLTQDDMDDIRLFMPWIMTTDEVPQYNLTYAGQQHVDDLDTYVFHVEPKKEEKNKRYFQGRVWVDNHDLQIVKLCGKSVPEVIHAKKKQRQELRPTFVTYRQPVDGYWFPAYTRVDDTLHFGVAEAIHLHEVIKFTGYKNANSPAAKP